MESKEHDRPPTTPGKVEIPKLSGRRGRVTSANRINTLGGFTEVIPGEFAEHEAAAIEEAVNKGLKVKGY